MTASSPDRPSAWVPAATCCQQARNRTKSATLAGSTRWRRRLRLAACRRTSRWRAHQRPSGSSMAEPAASSRARPVRARPRSPVRRGPNRLGAGPSATSCSDRHRAGDLEMPADALGQRRRRRRPSGRSTNRRSPRPMARRSVATHAPPTRPARPSVRSCSNHCCQAGHRPAQHQRAEGGRAAHRDRAAGAGPGRAPRPPRRARAGRARMPPPGARWRPTGPRPGRRGTARVRRSSSGAPSRKVKGRPVRMPWASGEGSADSTRWTPTRPASSVGEQPDQPDGVERLGQAVVDRLADQHVVGDGDRAGGGVLLAGGQRRPGRGQQVVGLHPLEVDRTPLAPAGAGHDQGPVEVPPPPGGQHRVEEDGLGQDVGRPCRSAASWAPGPAGSCAGGRGRGRRCRHRRPPGARSRRRRRTVCAGPGRGPG